MAAGNKRRRQRVGRDLHKKKLVPTGRRMSSSKRNCQNKVRYEDEQDAAQGMRRAQRKYEGQNQTVPIRFYPCPHCKGFHLTSRGSLR